MANNETSGMNPPSPVFTTYFWRNPSTLRTYKTILPSSVPWNVLSDETRTKYIEATKA